VPAPLCMTPAQQTRRTTEGRAHFVETTMGVRTMNEELRFSPETLARLQAVFDRVVRARGYASAKLVPLNADSKPTPSPN